LWTAFVHVKMARDTKKVGQTCNSASAALRASGLLRLQPLS